MTIALHVNTNVMNKNKSKNKKLRNTMSKQYTISRDCVLDLQFKWMVVTNTVVIRLS